MNKPSILIVTDETSQTAELYAYLDTSLGRVVLNLKGRSAVVPEGYKMPPTMTFPLEALQDVKDWLDACGNARIV